jgi:hypothetical protein
MAVSQNHSKHETNSGLSRIAAATLNEGSVRLPRSAATGFRQCGWCQRVANAAPNNLNELLNPVNHLAFRLHPKPDHPAILHFIQRGD